MAFLSTFIAVKPSLLVVKPSPTTSSSSSSLKHLNQLPLPDLRFPRTVTFAFASNQATAPRREPRGITKPRKISPELQALVGAPEISRTQALKVIWAYIKENNLQVESLFFFRFPFFFFFPCCFHYFSVVCFFLQWS